MRDRRRFAFTILAFGLAGAARAQHAPQQVREGSQREATTPAELDADLMEKLGLLEGHLIVGRALLEAGDKAGALPHFGHPVEELYAWLAPRIATRGAPPFEAELRALQALAEANDTGPAAASAWNAVDAKVRALRATVAPERARDARFLVEHVATMVEAAADDYAVSIERGRIANAMEYQDAAGFIRYAITVAEAQREAGGANRLWDAVLAELKKLLAAGFTTLRPPVRPPVTVASVRAVADRIRALPVA